MLVACTGNIKFDYFVLNFGNIKFDYFILIFKYPGK